MRLTGRLIDKLIVIVKWGSKKFDNLTCTPDQAGYIEIKNQLFQLTKVPPARQKLLFKGQVLKETLGSVPDESQLMMMGSALDSTSIDDSIKVLRESSQSTNTSIASTSEPKKSSQIPCGLENLGNTCYLNASLQLLSAILNITEILRRPVDEDQDDTTSNLQSLLRSTLLGISSSTDNDSTSYFTPNEFYAEFIKKYPQFFQLSPTFVPMQQDAEEAFSSICTFCRELPDPTGALFTALFEGRFSTKLYSMECPDVSPCISSEPFFKLSCHIGQNTNDLITGLAESLIETFQKESPTNEKDITFVKEYKISLLPQMLIVHFIRFYWKPVEKVKAKILKKVSFPLKLDLYNFCEDQLKTSISHDNSQGNGAIYELVGILTHTGRTADSGHYITWLRDKINHSIWWKMDDEKITQVSQEDILKLHGGGDWHMAYLSLYQIKK